MRNILTRSYFRKIPHACQQPTLELAINSEVRDLAHGVADLCRRAGRTAPPNDILITACARYHGCAIEPDDVHFTLLAQL